MPPEVQIDSSTIVVIEDGYNESVSFSDVDGNSYSYQAVFNTSWEITSIDSYFNGMHVATVEPLWHNGSYTGNLVNGPEGLWFITNSSGTLVTSGGGGGWSEDPCDEGDLHPFDHGVQEPCDDFGVYQAASNGPLGSGGLVRHGDEIYADGRLLVSNGLIMVPLDEWDMIMGDISCGRAWARFTIAGAATVFAYGGAAQVTIKSGGWAARWGWGLAAVATAWWVDEAVTVGQKCFRQE